MYSQKNPQQIAHYLALELDNLIITPHTAWASRQARQTILNQAAENLLSLTTSPVFIRQL